MAFNSELVLLPAIVLISLRTSLDVLCVLEAWSLSTVIVIGGCLKYWIPCGSMVSSGLLVVYGLFAYRVVILLVLMILRADSAYSCGADLKCSFGRVSYDGVAIGLRYFIVVDVVVFLVLSLTDLEFQKSIRGAHFRWGSVWAVSPRLSLRAYRQARWFAYRVMILIVLMILRADRAYSFEECDHCGCLPVAVIAWVKFLVLRCQKLWGFLTAVWWYDWGLVWLGRGGIVAILGSSCCRFGEGCLSRQWWPFWFRNYCHSYSYYGRRFRTVLTPFEHRVRDCWAADLEGLEWPIFMCLWVVGVAQRSVVDRGFRCSFVTGFSCGADLKCSFRRVSHVGVAIGLWYFIVVDVVVFLVLSVSDLVFWKSIRGVHFRWGSVWAVSPRLSFRAYRQTSFIFLNN
ncbi:hypothetical protein GIB67_037850 [Kingdonia uniflora]|uniref:Uncharacterized protein n=1 Tax=Kingdonia uniflora TaxID=39325 RepID=A0A7J7LH18_9MAGN|nr:hypothetical protein GIB67_037850 [Kingdonia uniflora]